MAEKNTLCKECASYKTHGEKCWFYWEHKTACTQYKDNSLDEPKYKALD